MLYVSSITEAELFSFPTLTKRETSGIEEFLNTVTIIHVDSRIARIAAELRRLTNIKLLDALIAATALSTHTTLLTRNVRDFRDVLMLAMEQV